MKIDNDKLDELLLLAEKAEDKGPFRLTVFSSALSDWTEIVTDRDYQLDDSTLELLRNCTPETICSLVEEVKIFRRIPKELIVDYLPRPFKPGDWVIAAIGDTHVYAHQILYFEGSFAFLDGRPQSDVPVVYYQDVLRLAFDWEIAQTKSALKDFDS